jgi:hypothetical protein
VVVSFLYLLARRVLGLLVLRYRSERSKDLEIVVLRHELENLRRRVPRAELRDADRVFLAAGARPPIPRSSGSSSAFEGEHPVGIPAHPRTPSHEPRRHLTGHATAPREGRTEAMRWRQLVARKRLTPCVVRRLKIMYMSSAV